MLWNETFHLVYIFLVIIRENPHHCFLSCDPRCYLHAATLHTPPPTAADRGRPCTRFICIISTGQYISLHIDIYPVYFKHSLINKRVTCLLCAPPPSSLPSMHPTVKTFLKVKVHSQQPKPVLFSIMDKKWLQVRKLQEKPSDAFICWFMWTYWFISATEAWSLNAWRLSSPTRSKDLKSRLSLEHDVLFPPVQNLDSNKVEAFPRK